MLSIAASLRNLGTCVPRALSSVSRFSSLRFETTQAAATPPAQSEQVSPQQQQPASQQFSSPGASGYRNRPRPPQRRNPRRNGELDMDSADSLNQVLLMGRVGSIDMTGNDEDMSRPRCRIALATSQNFYSPTGNPVRRTNWHRIDVMRPSLLNSVVAQLRRGDRLFVRGRLNYDIQRRLTGAEQVEQRFAKIFALEMVNLSREPVSTTDAVEEEAAGATEEQHEKSHDASTSKQ